MCLAKQLLCLGTEVLFQLGLLHEDHLDCCWTAATEALLCFQVGVPNHVPGHGLFETGPCERWASERVKLHWQEWWTRVLAREAPPV